MPDRAGLSHNGPGRANLSRTAFVRQFASSKNAAVEGEEMKREQHLPEGVEIRGAMTPEYGQILTHEALEFLAGLHRRFDARRRELLAARVERQKALDRGATLDFLPETRAIREADWKVAPVPADLQDRRV